MAVLLVNVRLLCQFRLRAVLVAAGDRIPDRTGYDPYDDHDGDDDEEDQQGKLTRIQLAHQGAHLLALAVIAGAALAHAEETVTALACGALPAPDSGNQNRTIFRPQIPHLGLLTDSCADA